jgi:hypothetical protein
MTNKPRIAICFFGITRSLSHTIGSIERNILDPARSAGDVKIFSHFFDQPRIENPRSGESGVPVANEHKLLSSDWLKIEEPDACLRRWNFAKLKSYGDCWHDDLRSLRNLVHQLHSLNAAATAAAEWSPSLYLFARPDLEYHDSFAPHLEAMLVKRGDAISIPAWQHWRGGYNDRFSICRSKRAATAYGGRISVAEEFCRQNGEPLHAERLLRYALTKSFAQVRTMNLRASRVRLDGTVRAETFRPYYADRHWYMSRLMRKTIR